MTLAGTAEVGESIQRCSCSRGACWLRQYIYRFLGSVRYAFMKGAIVKNPNKTVVLDGHPFDTSIKHLSLNSKNFANGSMDELKKLAEFESLTSACFAGTELDDIGLGHICQVVDLEDLNLQWTEISDHGLSSLAKLPRLSTLRLKENDQLTNECVAHLIKLENLADLQIHGTSIDQQGLKELVGLKNLRNLLIDSDNCGSSLEMTKELSLQMPDCVILVKGCGEFKNGKFEGKWGT